VCDNYGSFTYLNTDDYGSTFILHLWIIFNRKKNITQELWCITHKWGSRQRKKRRNIKWNDDKKKSPAGDAIFCQSWCFYKFNHKRQNTLMDSIEVVDETKKNCVWRYVSESGISYFLAQFKSYMESPCPRWKPSFFIFFNNRCAAIK
jgi:hypothetical protein